MYKIDKLLKLNRQLYHTKDLALLWNIGNTNTLYTTIKRYLKKGVLFSIYKGFYSTVPLDRLDPNLLGASALHTYCYLSLESVLAKYGVISQSPQTITFISSASRKIKIGNNYYLVRRLKTNFLLNTSGIEQKDGVFIAVLERAVSDILYFNSQYYFDNRKLINWKLVKKLQKEIGYL